MDTWPFSLAELTAGLRRYFADPTVRVVAVREWPLPRGYLAAHLPAVRGVRVEYSVNFSPRPIALTCVLKDLRPAPTAPQRVAPHNQPPGRREIGLFRSLAPQMPLATPALIAADTNYNWFLLEVVEAEPIACQAWQPHHYRSIVRAMAALHERFWGLGGDLGEYAWLGAPLAVDHTQQAIAAVQTFEQIIQQLWPSSLVDNLEAIQAVARLLENLDHITASVAAMPATLLHGGFNADSLLQDDDGEWVVVDWHAASIGPGVLDLHRFITNTLWTCGSLPVPVAELVELYRTELTRYLGHTWTLTDTAWAELWENVYLWRFVHELLPQVVNQPREIFELKEEHFCAFWLAPILAIVHRRFPEEPVPLPSLERFHFPIDLANLLPDIPNPTQAVPSLTANVENLKSDIVNPKSEIHRLQPLPSTF